MQTSMGTGQEPSQSVCTFPWVSRTNQYVTFSYRRLCPGLLSNDIWDRGSLVLGETELLLPSSKLQPWLVSTLTLERLITLFKYRFIFFPKSSNHIMKKFHFYHLMSKAQHLCYICSFFFFFFQPQNDPFSTLS